MLSLAITLVLTIIVDLGRPRESLTRVSQQPCSIFRSSCIRVNCRPKGAQPA
jgi:hypothetical protein